MQPALFSVCMYVYACVWVWGEGYERVVCSCLAYTAVALFFFHSADWCTDHLSPGLYRYHTDNQSKLFLCDCSLFLCVCFFFYISSVLLLFVNLLKCSPKQNCFSTAYKTIKLRSRIRQSIRNCCFCLLPFILRSACRLPFTVLAFNLELVIATLFSWLSANFTIHKCCFSVNTLPAALSVFHTFSLSLSLTISLFFISSRNQENLHYAKPLASLFCSCLMRLNLFRLDLFYFYFFFLKIVRKFVCVDLYFWQAAHTNHITADGKPNAGKASWSVSIVWTYICLYRCTYV